MIDYKKSTLSKCNLDFSYYENDIQSTINDNYNIINNKNIELAEELKFSCTNVMLQCLTPLNRCIFILGTMFKMNSKYSNEILGISSDNYRKRLSRSRKQMQEFLLNNCGLSGKGNCRCENRVDYAHNHGRIDKNNLKYKKLKKLDRSLLEEYLMIMESIDEKVAVFEELPYYRSNENIQKFIKNIVTSKKFKKILNFNLEDSND